MKLQIKLFNKQKKYIQHETIILLKGTAKTAC